MPTPRAASAAAARLRDAVAHHQAGRWQQAERLYHAVLRDHPAQPDALHLLGLLAHHRGDPARAVELITRALELHPRFPAALTNLGNALLAQGRAAESVTVHRRALAEQPGDPEIRANLGIALLVQGDAASAAAELEALLPPIRESLPVRLALAEAQLALGRLALAEQEGRGALLAAPGDFRANTVTGVAVLRAGRPADAVPLLQAAAAARPGSGLARSNLGAALRGAGRLDEAAAVLAQAVALEPGLADAHCNLGAVLTDLRRPAEALACFERAAELAPAAAEPPMNRSCALADLGRYQEAAAVAEETVARHPGSAPAWSALARSLSELGRHEAAIAAGDRALALAPGFAEARWNVSLPLLRIGRYQRGWQEFEARFAAWPQRLRRPPGDAPRWLGEPVAGKTVLAYWEQGFGDTIHFARYLPMLAQRGARVLLDCQAPLRPLLAGFPGVAALWDPAAGEVPDFQVALMSLPHWFGTTLETIPAAVPYLRAPARDGLVLLERGRRKVGLAWFGSPGQANNRFRSVPFAELLPLLAVPGIDWYSLQVGPGAADLAQAPAGAITDLAPRLADFGDTAAVMDQLDLIVTIDTATAHLAGALGRPVWILLAHACCWRYLLDRTDSPWYPTARLFRQPASGDWASVVAEVRAALDTGLEPT